MNIVSSFIKASTKLTGAAFLFGAIVSPQTSWAWTYNLTDGNSSVTEQADAEYGMSDFTVDGTTQLFRQQFWYRNGATGGEKPISSLALQSASQASANTLTTLYQAQTNPKFSIEVGYLLQGGAAGSGSSAIQEQIKITNLTGSALDFHFFQYVDFDLGGSHLGDTVTLERNALGLFERASQTKGNVTFANEVVSPAATHGEVGVSESILQKLKNNTPTTLNDSTGPVSGDAIWGFQWDMNIPAFGTYDISIFKSTSVVPEPTTAALLSIGAVLLGLGRRRLGLK